MAESFKPEDMLDKCQKLNAQLVESAGVLHDQVARAEAERDCYLEALEQLCAQGYLWDVSAVLEQGKKIRGES